LVPGENEETKRLLLLHNLKWNCANKHFVKLKPKDTTTNFVKSKAYNKMQKELSLSSSSAQHSNPNAANG